MQFYLSFFKEQQAIRIIKIFRQYNQNSSTCQANILLICDYRLVASVKFRAEASNLQFIPHNVLGLITAAWRYLAFYSFLGVGVLFYLTLNFTMRISKETIFEGKALIKTVKDEQRQSDLLAIAIMVAFRKFIDQIVKQLFYEQYNMLKESAFVKEWLEES